MNLCSSNSGSGDMFVQEISFDGGESSDRVTRLEDLLQLRKLYRNCLRAEYLLALPSPVYESMRQKSDPESYTGEEREEIENQITTKALETISDMQLTADELKVKCQGFGN